MRIQRSFVLAAVAMFALWWVAIQTSAQVAMAPQGQVALSELSPPIYPPLARAARIAGDVEITLRIRQDGSVESGEVVRGHPLLKAAALDSARQSKFECNDCGETPIPYSILYTFGYTTTHHCCQTEENSTVSVPPKAETEITQMHNHITILTEPFCTCDPRADIVKVRSAKCLFLWHCGKRYGL
jgi:TonB family protein